MPMFSRYGTKATPRDLRLSPRLRYLLYPRASVYTPGCMWQEAVRHAEALALLDKQNFCHRKSATPNTPVVVRSLVRRIIDRIALPLRSDPAWFEVVSIMAAVAWGSLAIMSSREFDTWPSMSFLAYYIGNAAPYIALYMAAVQGAAVFIWPLGQSRLVVRGVIAFMFSAWWNWLGVGISSSLDGLSMHSGPYLAFGVVNLMIMGRLGIEVREEQIQREILAVAKRRAGVT